MTALSMLAQQAQASGVDGYLIGGFLLFGLAVVFLLLELVVPSAGLIAALCTMCIAGGVLCFFLHSLLWGFASLALSLGGAPFAIGYGLRLWTSTPLARRAVLSTELPPPRPDAARPASGTAGIARTPMRPVGRVEIDGTLHDAIAEGEFIDPGQAVEVVSGDSGSLRVRARS